MPSYLRPVMLEEALDALVAGTPTIVAGGTDFYPARVGRPLVEDVLDVTGIPGLRGITEQDDHFLIGALTTWTDIIRADLPDSFLTLKLAAREVGGVQVQNSGTVVGNVCNASPAADGVPCLLALDATVVLGSTSGQREVAVADFIRGNRKTIRRPDELVLGLRVPRTRPGATSDFVKLGARKYLVISIVMVAAVLETSSTGTIDRIRIAVGSCSEVAKRLLSLEQDLVGRRIESDLEHVVREDHFGVLAPINDVRGSADYRMEAAMTLVRRVVSGLGSRELS